MHTIREAGGKRLACRPRSRGETCPHGRSLACAQAPRATTIRAWARRSARTASTTSGCALWNHNAGRLFKRTRTYVERELARQAGLTQKAARERVRVSYVEGGRVPAPRRRALPHALAPRRPRDDDELVPPPAEFDAQLLADAITAALPKATVPAEDEDAEPYGWGRQHEVRALELGGDLRRGRARGRLHRQVRDQVHRGRRRRRASGSRTSTSWATCAAASTRGG